MCKKLILIIGIFFIYLLTCHTIYINNISQNKISKSIKTFTNKEQPIGKLIIEKININNELYSLKSKHNNIEENITILDGSIEPNKENSIMFIAAHSGTGQIAYFKNLDKLKTEDEITLIYNEKTYNYRITKIWEEPKNGYIHVNKEKENQLVLTTCSPNKDNKQLIINSTLKRVY